MKKLLLLIPIICIALLMSCGNSENRNKYFCSIFYGDSTKTTELLEANDSAAYMESLSIFLKEEKRIIYDLTEKDEDCESVKMSFAVRNDKNVEIYSPANVDTAAVNADRRKNLVQVKEGVLLMKKEQLKREKQIKDSLSAVFSKVLKVTSYYLSSPNSAGGVDASFYYRNLSDKTIKYLVWTGYPMNAVGDVVSCDIRDRSDFSGKDTGPVKKGRTGGGCWDCAWYNWTAKKLIIESISIEYMDGSTCEIEGDNLKLVGIK